MLKWMEFSNPIVAGLWAIGACILWGSAFPVVKFTYAELNVMASDIYTQIFLAGLRFGLACLLLVLFFSLGYRQSFRIKSTQLGPLVVLGLLQTGVQYLFFYVGVANTTGIKGAVLTSAGTFFLVIMAHFVYGDDKLNLGKALGLILGLAGVVLVNWQPGGLGFSWDFSLLGEGSLLVTALVSALGTIQAKKLARSLAPTLINGWQLGVGSISLLLVGGSLGGPLKFTPLALLLLLYSAFLSAAAFSIWYTLLKHNKAGEITMYRFMIPVSGAILSAVLIPEESLTWPILVSLVLVALGIVAVYKRKPVPAKYRELSATQES